MMDYRLVCDIFTSLSDYHDPYNHHGFRVAQYSYKLAKMSGVFTEDEAELISYGAELHDLGRYLSPSRIWLEPRVLSESEMMVVRHHSAAGAAYCEKLNFHPVICNIVRHHHERWNGAGYPDKLDANHIPLEARVVGIVDYYVALISDRPYRKALSAEKALQVLNDHVSEFDPTLFIHFLEVLRDEERKRYASEPTQ